MQMAGAAVVAAIPSHTPSLLPFPQRPALLLGLISSSFLYPCFRTCLPFPSSQLALLYLPLRCLLFPCVIHFPCCIFLSSVCPTFFPVLSRCSSWPHLLIHSRLRYRSRPLSLPLHAAPQSLGHCSVCLSSASLDRPPACPQPRSPHPYMSTVNVQSGFTRTCTAVSARSSASNCACNHENQNELDSESERACASILMLEFEGDRTRNADKIGWSFCESVAERD